MINEPKGDLHPMKPIKDQARQGDVFIRRIPPHAKAKPLPVDPRGAVLAEGEMTGHHHRVQDARACLLRAEGVYFDILQIDGVKAVSLVHEEHTAIRISGGTFEVRRQCEWDWTKSLSRRVED